MQEHMLKKFLEVLSGSHNALYRGRDITDLFYDGTLSKQIAAGTFDDIFIGDYIIGKTSKRKYLVADIDYRLQTGDTECTTHHILMIPEKIMGLESMNNDATTEGAYLKSKMHDTFLEKYRSIIKNDFDEEHILKHRAYFQNVVTNGYSSSGSWTNSDIDLMNEIMVFGSFIQTPRTAYSSGTSVTAVNTYTIDKLQLSLFRLNPTNIIATDENGTRCNWWLRDVQSSVGFCGVGQEGVPSAYSAERGQIGVRPAFLIV